MTAFNDHLRGLLLPLTPLYRLGLHLREQRLASGREPVRRLPYPVVSIGNLSTGGSGKTPLAIALAQALTARGFQVNVLSRGYGRRTSEAARVDPTGSGEDYGDEPILIARRGATAREATVPVYVASQRFDAGQLALHTAPHFPKTIFLLDDGFQHRQLHRDVDILLLDRRDFHDRLLPAGNLREPLEAATRASVIAIPADDPEFEPEVRAWLAARNFAGQLWRLQRRMEIPPEITPGTPVLAFCGIARPEQFFRGLEAAGLRLTRRIALRDHHRFTDGDLRRLDEEARETGAKALITTEKDQVRLPEFAWSIPLLTTRLITEIADAPTALDGLVDCLTLSITR